MKMKQILSAATILSVALPLTLTSVGCLDKIVPLYQKVIGIINKTPELIETYVGKVSNPTLKAVINDQANGLLKLICNKDKNLLPSNFEPTKFKITNVYDKNNEKVDVNEYASDGSYQFQYTYDNHPDGDVKLKFQLDLEPGKTNLASIKALSSLYNLTADNTKRFSDLSALVKNSLVFNHKAIKNYLVNYWSVPAGGLDICDKKQTVGSFYIQITATKVDSDWFGTTKRILFALNTASSNLNL